MLFRDSFYSLETPPAGGVLSGSLLLTDPYRALVGPESGRMARLPLAVQRAPPTAYPGSIQERLEGFEVFQRITFTPQNTPLLWELLRVQVPGGCLCVLERLGCYLSATPAGGAPQAIFGTVDPGVIVGDLAISWGVAVERAPDWQIGNFAVAAPVQSVLFGGLETVPGFWPDFRYAFAGRYTLNRPSRLQGLATIRFFVSVSTPSAWTVTAGGLLGGWRQLTRGEGGATERNARKR